MPVVSLVVFLHVEANQYRDVIGRVVAFVVGVPPDLAVGELLREALEELGEPDQPERVDSRLQPLLPVDWDHHPLQRLARREPLGSVLVDAYGYQGSVNLPDVDGDPRRVLSALCQTSESHEL